MGIGNSLRQRALLLVTCIPAAALIASITSKMSATEYEQAAATPGTPLPSALAATERSRIQDNFGKLPLSFIENQGQIEEQVAYYIQSPGHSLYFTRNGHALRLTGGKGEDAKSHTVKVELVDAVVERIESLDRAPGIVSYFKGPKEQWKTGIPTHARIAYFQPWPGIDLAYDGYGGKLESIYTVAPHANPAQIKLRYAGQDSLRLDDDGNLIYTTSVGEVKETAPIIYQEIDGKRVTVDGSYRLLDDTTVGFQVAVYNPDHALVIDPTLVYSGFVGSSSSDDGLAIAVDSAGNAYVTGFTAGFSGTVGPDLTYNGGGDAFVVKVNAAGSALVYAGFIGGTGEDEGRGIAVDSAGDAYVTGYTNSTQAMGFPVTVGPDSTYNGGSFDGFVVKVNSTGTALVYAGYIGGSGGDFASDIAVDSTANAYLTGRTNSTQTTFPDMVGPDLSYSAFNDAFVAKVAADGSGLVYAGYIGGTGDEEGTGIATDSAGNAYVSGWTTSTEATFPVTGGPDLTFNGSTKDAFVTKVSADGSALVYAGYIGGSGDDSASDIAVDSAGNAYVTGETDSTETTFPATVGPDLTYNGGNDVFVAKVNADGNALVYAGYIGGSGGDGTAGSSSMGVGIDVDSAGNAYVTASTNSTEATFPVLRGPDLTFNGGFDAFVAKVNAAGVALVYAGYVGGSQSDYGYGIAVDPAGNAYVIGQTGSTEATFPVMVGPDLTYNGAGDAFVAKIGSNTTPDNFSFTDQTGANPSTTITSNAVTISGIDAPAAISVSGAAGSEYSVGCTATFTNSASTIGDDQTVCVRHTSSASFSTPTNTTLTVGGVADTFTSTTIAQDTTPNGFSFTDQTGVAPGTLVTSNVVTISGINAPAAISVSGGEYSIDCTGTFVSAAGSISNGQAVCVQHTSSASFSTPTDTTLTVGSVTDTFTSTTIAQDTTPNGFSFTDQTGVARNILITSNAVTISGINDAAPISVSGGEYSVGCTGAFRSTSSTISSSQTVCVRHTSSASFSTATDTVLTIGGVSDTFTSTTTAQDIQPNQFTFTDVTNAPPNSVQTSNAVTISGINDAAPISVFGGEYSVGCTSTFSSSGSTISNNQTVCVRHTASGSFSSTTDTTLTIGSTSDTFTSTTQVQDTQPDQFSFTDKTDASLGSVQTSNTVTISGINDAAAIGVTGGSYSVGCTGAFRSTNSTISDGQTVCVRHTVSAAFGTATNTVLTIGGVSDTFTSTTLAQDIQPDQFSFADLTNAPLNSVQTSNAVTISDINDAAPISVSGGEYSIGCTGTFTSSDDTITSGQTVCVQHTASAADKTMTSTTLFVGGVMDTFTSTTGDSTPNAFTFTAQNGVASGTTVTSNTITISGMTLLSSIAVSGGEYSVDGAVFTSSSGSIFNNQTVAVRHASAGEFSNSTTTTLTIGGVAGTFTSTTGAQGTTPDAFSFTDQIEVPVSSSRESNIITVTGITGSVSISVTGGEYRKNSGSYTSFADTAQNGDTVQVRHTASASFSTATQTVLTIGTVSATFTSTTGAAPPSGGGGGGGAVNAFLMLVLILLSGVRRCWKASAP